MELVNLRLENHKDFKNDLACDYGEMYKYDNNQSYFMLVRIRYDDCENTIVNNNRKYDFIYNEKRWKY